jgi:Ca-activated chloride channel family protein
VLSRLIDFESLRFGEPLYLWLLIVPAVLFVLWCVQLLRQRADARRFRALRLVPIRERFAAIGELAFWLGLIAALSLTILALSRPQGITAIVRSPGVDIVLLMDGSTSMRVRDMGVGDRWQRSMQWVRTLTKTLGWTGDRMALATFADIAVPQIRLTRDANTILFFLDHLDDAPTFRLENETSWNTNVEDAIYWGVKLVDTDMQMYGPSKNARSFVVVSDGQVWSGNVQRAINEAAKRGIAVDVIGVGTSNGGIIPLPRDDKGVALAGFEPIRSTIDRNSLREIARAGNGEYFEIGTAPDEQIAARIIQNAARRSGNQQVDESLDDLYWYLLVAAACCIGLGILFVKQRLQLGLGFAAALALVALISSLRS